MINLFWFFLLYYSNPCYEATVLTQGEKYEIVQTLAAAEGELTVTAAERKQTGRSPLNESARSTSLPCYLVACLMCLQVHTSRSSTKHGLHGNPLNCHIEKQICNRPIMRGQRTIHTP